MGVTLCDESDVKARLQLAADDDLAEAQQTAWPPLAQEATVLVEGFLGRQWDDLMTVPVAVRVVTSRMTVRAMVGGGDGATALVDGQQGSSSTFGPMGYTRRFGTDAVFTSPWLSKSDRQALAPYVAVSAVHNEPMFDLAAHDRSGYDFEPGWCP